MVSGYPQHGDLILKMLNPVPQLACSYYPDTRDCLVLDSSDLEYP